MAALSVQVPYPVFYDRDGQPLDNGNIYIGDANLDPIANPLQVYYDEALTIAATQPLKTSNGYVYRNGTPAQIYVNADNFSILVRDSNNTLVYSFPDGASIVAGANSIVYNEGSVGAIDRTVELRLQDRVSIKDFGAIGDGITDDTDAINAAANAARMGSKALFLPAVASWYVVSDTIDFSGLVVVDGKGAELRGTFGAIPAIILGDNISEGYFWLEIRNSADKSTTSGNCGFLLRSMSMCKLWLYARGFNEGIYFDGAVTSRAWVSNEFNILHLYNNGSQSSHLR